MLSKKTSGHRRSVAAVERFIGLESLEPRTMLAADFTATFNALTPTTQPSGGEQTVVLNITNIGDAKAAGTARIDFFLSADGVQDAGDKFITSAKVPVGAITPGATLSKPYKLTIATSAAAGNYRLIAVVDAGLQIAENNETNNAAVSDELAVTQPDYDLSAAITEVKLKTNNIVANNVVKGTAKVELTNNGTANLAKKQNVTVNLFARPVGAVDAGGDILVLKQPVKPTGLNNLKGGAVKKLSLNVEFSANVPIGNYQLFAVVDTAGDLAETNEANNTALAALPIINVASAFVDLSVAVPNPTLPSAVVAGAAAKITLPVEVTNNGNVPLANGQKIDIQVFARPAATPDDSANDVLVTTAANQSVAGLKPGAVKKMKIKVELPANLAQNSYILVAKVDTANAVAESNENNNSSATSTNQAINVAAAFTDLVLQTATTTLSGTLAAGTAGKGTVTFINNGNVDAKGKVKVEFFATAAGVIQQGVSPLLGTLDDQSISLKPGSTKSLTANLTAPDVNGNTNYQIVARLTPVEGIVDSNPVNVAAAGSAITVTESPSFLVALGDTLTFTQTGFSDGSNGLGGAAVESGTWADTKGHSGTYSYTSIFSPFGGQVNKVGSFILTSDSGLFATLNLTCTFKGVRPLQVNAKSIRFSASGAGDGKVGVTYGNGPFVHKDGVFDVL